MPRASVVTIVAPQSSCEPTGLASLRDFRIVHAQLFGSAARGELTPTNDIDLLTEPAELVGLVSFSYYGKDLKR